MFMGIQCGALEAHVETHGAPDTAFRFILRAFGTGDQLSRS